MTLTRQYVAAIRGPMNKGSIVVAVLQLPVLSVLLPLGLSVYLRLIIGTLFLCISAHLTVLLLSR